MKVVRFLGATALATAALAFPGAAFAQSTPTAEQCKEDPKLTGCATNSDGSDSSGSTIVVTGSRIARPTLTSPVPVTSVTAEDILSQGDLNVGDALNDLPSLRGTFSQSNSTRSIGTAGLNFLDLRGLGIARTLVLVNGRRHVTALAGDFFVDTNTIPSSLLERTDIVTGGNSAVYGSDAIGGVVNFVLKKNYDGFRVTGQGGISSRGDRGLSNVTATFGRNFADGRGNIAVSLDYLRFREVAFTGRAMAVPVIRQHLVLLDKRYLFSGQFMTSRFQANEGLAWTINCASDNREIARTPAIKDTSSLWQPFSFEFEVPSNCANAVTLQLQTYAPYESGTGLRGQVTFDDFKLETLQ